MSVYQLFYVSTAKVGIEQFDVDQILLKARLVNPSKKLTGVLLFRDGIFLQLLEGDKADVQWLYQKIKKDSRHRNIFTIFDKVAENRLFRDWSMGYCEIGPIQLKMVNEVIGWKRLTSGKDVSSELILDLLAKFKAGI